jgi:hypothetical protein
MTPDRAAAIVAGAAALVLLYVFFFGKRRPAVAAKTPRKRAARGVGETAARAIAAKTPTAGPSVDVVVEGGYTPDLIVARRGVPLDLVFDRREESPCSDEVVLPEFGIRRPLPAHAKTVVRIVPKRTGEFPFSCGMNMLHGTIRVVDSASEA